MTALATIAALVVLLAWQVLNAGKGANLVAEVKSGNRPPAPAFHLAVIWDRSETWPARLRGKIADGSISLSELRGSPVVVNFWASWCVPCKEEAPILASSARRHAGKVAFVGLDIHDFKSDALRFLNRYRVNYVSIRDKGDGTYRAYGLTGVPETYFLDRLGRVVAHTLGAISERELEEGIRQAEVVE